MVLKAETTRPTTKATTAMVTASIMAMTTTIHPVYAASTIHFTTWAITAPSITPTGMTRFGRILTGDGVPGPDQGSL